MTSIIGLSLLTSSAHKAPEEKQEWLLSRAKTELDLNKEQLNSLKTAITDLGLREDKSRKAE